MKLLTAFFLVAATAATFAGEESGFTPVPFSELTQKHLDRECIVFTDITDLNGGMDPPEDMLTMGKNGIIYHGRLAEISKDSILIIALQGAPGVAISKDHIRMTVGTYEMTGIWVSEKKHSTATDQQTVGAFTLRAP